MCSNCNKSHNNNDPNNNNNNNKSSSCSNNNNNNNNSNKMLVPADMIGPQSKLLFQVNKYYGDRVHQRKYTISKTIREICKVVQDVLKEVEVQEPRYISSLSDINGRFEGFDVISPTEFEVVLYLNQVRGNKVYV